MKVLLLRKERKNTGRPLGVSDIVISHFTAEENGPKKGGPRKSSEIRDSTNSNPSLQIRLVSLVHDTIPIEARRKDQTRAFHGV